jgi:beta-glucosidase
MSRTGPAPTAAANTSANTSANWRLLPASCRPPASGHLQPVHPDTSVQLLQKVRFVTVPDFSPRKDLSPAGIDRLVSDILAEATLEEKVAMMSGHGFFALHAASGVWGSAPYPAGGGLERLGIAPLYFSDGPRGVARGQSTAFPCTMARGASFDRDLERRVGEVMGRELRAQGCNLSGAVCVNLLRHPGWGRAQETYGEDPYHLGEMGAALCTGIQTHNVIATVKHFAANSIENNRFRINVRIGERALREVYLPHFKKIIDAGCGSVMSAYNKLNGEYCGENRRLLTDILRHEWGFEGFVHSDWILGVHAPWAAAAGLDIENPEPVHFGRKLLDAVAAGSIAPGIVETACRRILTTLYRFLCAEDPLEAYPAGLVACQEHTALALEVAEKSAVLIRNTGVLPLSPDTCGPVAVFGRLAMHAVTGDNGSSRVRPPYVISPLQGLQDFASPGTVFFAGDETDPAGAAHAAAAAGTAIIIAGYTPDEEGEFIPGDLNLGQDLLPEGFVKAAGSAGYGGGNAPRGGDRMELTLPAAQVALIEAVARVNPRTIVVIVAGSAVLIRPWGETAASVLQTFYAGMEGGRALARLLFGAVSPSGRLPFTLAAHAGDYPHFDPYAEEIEYGYLHGYTLFDKQGLKADYPFGHGLSYAHFAYRALKARRRPCGGIAVQVTLVNQSGVAAREIAQLYLAAPGREAERPRKLLSGFQAVDMAPHEVRTLLFDIPAEDLRWYDERTAAWRTEPGAHGILVGGSSAAAEELRVNIVL